MSDDDLDVREALLARRIAAELRKPAPAIEVHPCARCGEPTSRVLLTVQPVCETCEPIRRVVPDDDFRGPAWSKR